MTDLGRWVSFRIFLGALLPLHGCFHTPQNELESMTEIVIKKREGIDIKVIPIDVPKAP